MLCTGPVSRKKIKGKSSKHTGKVSIFKNSKTPTLSDWLKFNKKILEAVSFKTVRKTMST